jgi:membrane associated rhomboid family serine protease
VRCFNWKAKVLQSDEFLKNTQGNSAFPYFATNEFENLSFNLHQFRFMVTFLLIIANLAISYRAFNNYAFQQQTILHVGRMRSGQWYRLVSSGFIHNSWQHLIFNMLSLYFVGSFLEDMYAASSASPVGAYLLLYFGSMVGGSYLAWFLNRNDSEYSAAGASGAISGLLFALAIMVPHGTFFRIIPIWLYAILYMLYTLYALQKNGEKICHEGHLGGALIGMAIACLLTPQIVPLNWYVILPLTLIPAVFLFLLIQYPLAIMDPRLFFKMGNFGSSMGGFGKSKQRRGPRVVHVRKDEPVSAISTRRELQTELDDLLEKVGKKGLSGLSKKERKRLDELSAILNGNRSSDN